MNRQFRQIRSQILLHPLTIAIPFALITILLIHHQFNSVLLEPLSLADADKAGKNTTQYYYDLDHDSVDEEISHFTNDVKQCAIKLRNEDGSYLGQWNFNGFLPEKSRDLLFLDLNNDNVEDIFMVYQRNDSVFIGGINSKEDDVKLLDDIFVDRVNLVNGETDFSTQLSACDLNRDGNDEIIISLSANFSEQPRRIYAYDYTNDTLIVSPIVGFIQVVKAINDLDKDGYPEIIPQTISYENIEENQGIPFHDYDRWFVVYNHKLEFKFGPYNLGKGNGRVETFIFDNDTSALVLILDINNDSLKRNTFYTFKGKSGKLERMYPEIDLKGRIMLSKYYIGKLEFLFGLQSYQRRIEYIGSGR